MKKEDRGRVESPQLAAAFWIQIKNVEGKPNDCAKIVVAIVIFLAPNLVGAKIAPYLRCIILNSIRVASDVTRTGSTSFFSSRDSLRIFLESDGYC